MIYGCAQLLALNSDLDPATALHYDSRDRYLPSDARSGVPRQPFTVEKRTKTSVPWGECAKRTGAACMHNTHGNTFAVDFLKALSTLRSGAKSAARGQLATALRIH